MLLIRTSRKELRRRATRRGVVVIATRENQRIPRHPLACAGSREAFQQAIAFYLMVVLSAVKSQANGDELK